MILQRITLFMVLKTRCPTLSPFATCDDKMYLYQMYLHRFLNLWFLSIQYHRRLFRNGFLFMISLYSHFLTKVATGIIWLDTTALRNLLSTHLTFGGVGRSGKVELIFHSLFLNRWQRSLHTIRNVSNVYNQF